MLANRYVYGIADSTFALFSAYEYHYRFVRPYMQTGGRADRMGSKR